MSRTVRLRSLLLLLAPVVLLALGIAWYTGALGGAAHPPANSILIIAPYRYNGAWVFDDESAGLVREPFVGGVRKMIDILVADIPDADDGFRLTFSARPFPDFQKKLTWMQGDSSGNYYALDDPPMKGWICPALFKYYEQAPPELYVKADPR